MNNYTHFKPMKPIYPKAKEAKIELQTKELKVEVETKTLEEEYFELTGQKADGRWSEERLKKEVEDARLHS